MHEKIFVRKLDMEIKCKFNPYYLNQPPRPEAHVFCGRSAVKIKQAVECADIFVKRPVAEKSAAGLFGNIKKYARSYVKNIKHTYDHKIIFALVEKELFGRNSIDSITHDLDKLLLYLLAFPKSFVSKFHRKHSVHHTESGKKPNLKSMLCDNIASSPEFKPEKKNSLRVHYQTSKELQNVQGLGDIFEKYNYGESLNFDRIKAKKEAKYSGIKGLTSAAVRLLLFI